MPDARPADDDDAASSARTDPGDASVGGNESARTWSNTASRTLFLSIVLSAELGRICVSDHPSASLSIRSSGTWTCRLDDGPARVSLARIAIWRTISCLTLHHFSRSSVETGGPSEVPYLKQCPRCDDDMSRISRFSLSSSAW